MSKATVRGLYMLLGVSAAGGVAPPGECALLMEDGYALLTEGGVEIDIEQCGAGNPCPPYSRPLPNAVNLNLDEAITVLPATATNINICEPIT